MDRSFKYRAVNQSAPVLSVFPYYFLAVSLCRPSRIPRKQKTGEDALNVAVFQYIYIYIYIPYIYEKPHLAGSGQAEVTGSTNPTLCVIVTPPSRGDILALNPHKPCSVSRNL